MNRQDFEIIGTYQLFLRDGQQSEYMRLHDPDGGDIYVTFRLKRVPDDTTGYVRWRAADDIHAEFEIEYKQGGVVTPEAFIEIATMGHKPAPVFVGFVIQPVMPGTDVHPVTVSFLTPHPVYGCTPVHPTSTKKMPVP